MILNKAPDSRKCLIIAVPNIDPSSANVLSVSMNVTSTVFAQSVCESDFAFTFPDASAFLGADGSVCFLLSATKL